MGADAGRTAAPRGSGIGRSRLRVRLGHSATSAQCPVCRKADTAKRSTSTRPNKRDRSSLAVGRSPASESEPLAACCRSPIPATVSIAVAGVSPRRGRSSALARSIGLDQPKEGPGGGVDSRHVPQDRGRAASRNLVRVELERCRADWPPGTTRAKPPSTRFQPRATDRVCPKIAAHVPEPEGRISSTGWSAAGTSSFSPPPADSVFPPRGRAESAFRPFDRSVQSREAEKRPNPRAFVRPFRPLRPFSAVFL